MSATFPLEEECLRGRQETPTTSLKCEPGLCWRELVQLALDGIYPTDQRLENFLDRIERMP